MTIFIFGLSIFDSIKIFEFVEFQFCRWREKKWMKSEMKPKIIKMILNQFCTDIRLIYIGNFFCLNICDIEMRLCRPGLPWPPRATQKNRIISIWVMSSKVAKASQGGIIALRNQRLLCKKTLPLSMNLASLQHALKTVSSRFGWS